MATAWSRRQLVVGGLVTALVALGLERGQARTVLSGQAAEGFSPDVQPVRSPLLSPPSGAGASPKVPTGTEPLRPRPPAPETTPTSSSVGAPPPTEAGRVAAAAEVPGAPESYFGPKADPRSVYLTVDDGWFPSLDVISFMKRESVPLTTFLIVDAAQDQLDFWKKFVDAGGQIQNHTASHPWLTRLPIDQVRQQWLIAQDRFYNWFGSRPTIGRPPYGATSAVVSRTARESGLNWLAMWSATDNGGGLRTWNSRTGLQSREITLSHWDPGVLQDLEALLAAARAAGLNPSLLPAELPGP